MDDIISLFTERGGVLVTPPAAFRQKLVAVKAVLFDWDGVFNEGFKQGTEGSAFSEVDAMGTNMLRYALWRQHGRLPITAIITGENNPSAVHLAKRESFHNAYLLAKNKGMVFADFLKTYQLDPAEVAFFFDDVLDVEVARQCGIRIMISRKGAPMFHNLVRRSGCADYLTACDGAGHGLREGCELCIGMLHQFDEVIRNRTEWSANYQEYLSDRKAIQPVISESRA